MLIMLIVPALIALGALALAAVLHGHLARASPGGRIALWIVIVLLGAVAFGIGGCYAWAFGFVRFGG